MAEAAAAPADAPEAPIGAELVALSGSSTPTGAPPAFLPIATAPAAATDVQSAASPDAAVLDIAGRLAALAPRHLRVLSRALAIEDRVDRWYLDNRPARPPERASCMVMSDVSTATHRIMQLSEPLAKMEAIRREAEAHAAAREAHDRLRARKLARTRSRYLMKLADRMWDRMARWATALADLRPVTRDGLMAKTAAAVAVAANAREEEWAQALTESTNRDALRLAACSAVSPVEAEADRVAALARREWAAAARDSAADDRAASDPSPRHLSAARAARRLMRRLSRRLRRDVLTLAGLPASDPAAVAAKARAVLAIGAATDDEGWWAELRDAVVREAAGLGRAPALPAEAPAGLGALSAEWLRTSSLDGRDRDAMAALTPQALAEPDALDVFQANARAHGAVLRRLAALRSTSPDVLALKAAAVVAGCRDAAGLDAEVAKAGGPDMGGGELSVALSLARDVAALFGDPVAPIVRAANLAQDLPTIDRHPLSARAAA